DADEVRYVFMLRKTRSRRLYEQALGRGTRPLVGIRDAISKAPDAESRRRIIAASGKPYMVMVDLVGVHDEAKDLGVIDILGGHLPTNLRERTKRKMTQEKSPEAIDVGEVARQARDEMKQENEQKRVA